MLKKIYAAGLIGTKGVLVRCEADVEQGFPTITFIGSLAASVREAADRVRTALGNSGFRLEPRRVTLNLSPAELRKEGCAYDVPIAVALLAAYGQLPEQLLTDTLFAGELSLSGEILPVRGVLSMVRCAEAAGLKRCFLPLENLREGSVIGGIDCYGVSTLSELVELLRGKKDLPAPAVYAESSLSSEDTPDFSDLAGQELVKRATLLAAGGRHNILYIGPAGTGKSMIAARLPHILPAMSREERLSVSESYSISGLLPSDKPLMTKRPYRSPHHTVTGLALSGGGQKPRPGEISLAHEGVLFLDELPEYHAATLEILRQPLEEHLVHISRVSGNFTFPANFQLVCAMNPCKCGFWPDRNRCRCTEAQVRTYLSHISKPLLDRIDLCAETESVPFSALQRKERPKENPAMQRAVERVRNIQERRFQGSGIHFNAEMTPAQIEAHCSLCREDSEFLEALYNSGAMSARALHKLLKVARTAADFDGAPEIQRSHLAEALAYRSPEEKYWGSISKLARQTLHPAYPKRRN